MNNRLKTLILVLARSGILAVVLFLLSYFIQFELNFYLIFCSILTGVVFSKYFLSKNLRLTGIISLILISATAYWLLSQLLFLFWPAGDFTGYYFAEHLKLLLLVFALSLVSSFLFWKSSVYTYLELSGLLLIIVQLFAPHRSYKLDFFKFINDLAWQYNSEALYIYCFLSFLVAICFFTYITLYNSFQTNGNRLVSSQSSSAENLVRSNWAARIINSLVFLALIFVCFSFSDKIYQRHKTNADSALQNGVGTENEEGVSPLNFDSALGTSSQPAALVRFKKDYLNNPLSPLLYLRESALSELKGNQLVLAGKRYDQDLSRSRITQRFSRTKELYSELRSELETDTYLLANFNDAFTLDYPLSISPLVLSATNRKRFKAGFRANSLVPNFKFEQIFSRQVGAENWTDNDWQHYTRTHSDPRYQKFAQKILQGLGSRGGEPKIIQAARIVYWLTKNATYTLTPHHNVAAKADPTAAFLFGDLRGYCVHFAHATTYMLRSLGIPTRVATGFMTDLSQAKDGHILLRMSDRHAWAEVYVRDLGWIPFDTQPEQVENHADTPVDQGLLDDLIDSLTTDIDPISEDQLADEPFLNDFSPKVYLPEKKQVTLFLCLFFISLVLRKFWLYSGWRFSNKLRKKHLRFYRALSAILTDLNLQRISGETTDIWLKRVSRATSQEQAALIKNLNYIFYQTPEKQADVYFQPVELNKFYKGFMSSLSLRQRVQILFNPQSVFYIFR